MTDNQFKQMMNLMTKSVTSTQRIEKEIIVIKSDIAELKADVSELKAGQARLEKAMDTNNKALDSLAGESIRVKARVDVLEEEFSN